MSATKPTRPARTSRLSRSHARMLVVRVAAAPIAVGFGLLAVINPLLALGAFVAIASTFVLLPRADLAVAAFAAATYFEVAVNWTGPAASPIKLLGAFVIAIAALTIIVPARQVVAPIWRHHPRLLVLSILLVGWAAASLSWAEFPADVKTLTIRLLTDVLIFLAVPLLLRSTRDLRLLGWTIVGASLAGAALGALGGYNSFGRAVGLFQDPNEFASATVVGAAFALALGESSSSRLVTWSGRGAAALAMLAVVTSASRTGLAATLLAFFVLMLTARGVERARLAGIMSFGIAVMAGWTMLAPGGAAVTERLGEEGSTGRTDLWKVAIYQFADEPVHGVGLGNYPNMSIRYLRRDVANLDLFIRQPRRAHNTPLELLSELGMVGFALYYSFTFGCMVVARRALRRARLLGDELLVGMCRGVLTSLWSLLAASVTLSALFVELHWILFGTCIALAGIVRAADRRQAEVDAEPLVGLALDDGVEQLSSPDSSHAVDGHRLLTP